jgi:hypothetical protein
MTDLEALAVVESAKSSQCLNKVSRYIVIAVPERKAELPARALEDNTSGDGLGNTAFGQRKDTGFPTSP